MPVKMHSQRFPIRPLLTSVVFISQNFIGYGYRPLDYSRMQP